MPNRARKERKKRENNAQKQPGKMRDWSVWESDVSKHGVGGTAVSRGRGREGREEGCSLTACVA